MMENNLFNKLLKDHLNTVSQMEKQFAELVKDLPPDQKAKILAMKGSIEKDLKSRKLGLQDMPEIIKKVQKDLLS